MSLGSTGLHVGVNTPWGLWSLDPKERTELIGSIADQDLDFLFCADHVSFRGGAGTDGIVQMAALSGIDARLDVYVGVFLLALRHPVVAARQIATLAEAASGRLTVGVGVGGEDRHEFEVCEIDPATRGRRTDVALDIVQRLLAGESVDGDGEFFHFEDARIQPSPKPTVPITIGGRSDAALHRAALRGDGWLAAWCSARRLAQGIAQVEEQAAAAGRDVDMMHGIQLWVGVGETPELGRAAVAEGMEKFYRMPFEPFERYTPVGPAEAIAEFLAPYVDAGASTLNLAPVGPDRATEIATIAEVKRLLA